MTAKEIFDNLTIDYGLWLVVILTLIQIVPIKINPWSFIFDWIGKKITGELNKKVDSLQTEVKEMKREFEIKNANDMRWDILDFSNSCRNGRIHSREEWKHVIDQLKMYETYVNEHSIDNGVIEEETKYLRELYHERCVKNDFL